MQGDPPVLAPPVLAAMLADTATPAGSEIDAAVAARIKRGLLARLDQPAFRVLDEPGWRAWVPGADRKTLFDSGVTRSWLVRMQAGASLPPHVHDEGDEECVVLQGEVWVDGRCLHAGDYTVALRGSRHDAVCTLTGALIYLRTPSPRRPAASA